VAGQYLWTVCYPSRLTRSPLNLPQSGINRSWRSCLLHGTVSNWLELLGCDVFSRSRDEQLLREVQCAGTATCLDVTTRYVTGGIVRSAIALVHLST
jgi:hypothetical protein